jgi:hypothetical protein
MWKRERTCSVSPCTDSTATWLTRWLVSHCGACDQALGCMTRPRRISISDLSSMKIEGEDSHSVCSGATGIQYTPSWVNRSIHACQCLPSSSSACR